MSIYADRSRMVSRQTCRKQRYYGYDYIMPGAEEGGFRGMSKQGGRWDAEFGILFHLGMSDMLISGQVRDIYLLELQERIPALAGECFPDMPPEHLAHFITEQSYLLGMLMRGFEMTRLASLLKQYEVISVEDDHVIRFMPQEYLPENLAAVLQPLEVPFRMDATLKHKETGAIFILDFKTAGMVSQDWNIALDNSLQSCLYVEATELLWPEEYVGGIFYAGAVKGKRELDKAKSSPYNGMSIQYGSFLYGWVDKNESLQKDYVQGRKRKFIGYHWPTDNYITLWNKLKDRGYNIESYFPITVPWKPINKHQVVGQQIVAENSYQGDLEMMNEMEPHSVPYLMAEGVLLEQSLGSCYKYGSKHGCPFIEICHGGLEGEEIRNMYTPRIPHHEGEEA